MLGWRLLIDIGSEAGLCAKMGHYWHTGRTPRRYPSPTFPPPFPLHSPSIHRPYTVHTPKVTSSVPFWHSSGCPGPSEAVGKCEVIEGFRGKLFRLTFRRVGVQREGRRQKGEGKGQPAWSGLGWGAAG